MRRLILSLVVFSLTLLAWNAQAQTPQTQSGKTWGVGIILGDPTAITLKHRISERRALDFGFGYHWHDSFLFYGDYLFQFPGTFKTDSKEVNTIVPYVGVGPAVSFHTEEKRKRVGDREVKVALMGRIPLGLNFVIPDSPLELFAEIVPLINIIPGLDFGVGGGIGIRVFF